MNVPYLFIQEACLLILTLKALKFNFTIKWPNF